MGPSGAGKTSFMNVLCDRAGYGVTSGVLTLNVTVSAPLRPVESMAVMVMVCTPGCRGCPGGAKAGNCLPDGPPGRVPLVRWGQGASVADFSAAASPPGDQPSPHLPRCGSGAAGVPRPGCAFGPEEEVQGPGGRRARGRRASVVGNVVGGAAKLFGWGR